MLNFDIRVDSIANEAVADTGGNSDVFDVSKVIGNLFLNISARAGGTATMALTVEHSEASGSGFGAVPASALFNPATGDADTFDSVTTAATDQTLALNTQQLKRYLRVVYAGTGLAQEIAVTVAYQAQYTEF